jgi:hypothetical protein
MAVTSVDHGFKPHLVPECRRPGLYAYRTWTKSVGRVVQTRTGLLDCRLVQAFNNLSLLRA